MERFPRTSADADQLIQLGKLLNEVIQTVTKEWSEEKFAKKGGDTNGVNGAKAPTELSDTADVLPSWPLFQAQRTIHSIAGALTELVTEPHNRLTEFMGGYWESRALFIAAERRIPDLLDAAGPDGLDVKAIAKQTGIEHLKLSRLLQCLASNHILRLSGPERFANNRISQCLVHNEPMRAYVMNFNLDLYTAAERLPKYLLGPKGASYSVTEAAWHEAIGTKKPRWDWLAERVSPSEIQNDGIGYPGVPDSSQWAHLKPDADGKVARPELEIFGPAMVGGGRATGPSQPFDFPWKELPEGATIVDVGGGVGGFCMQLLKVYPHFNCVVEDRAEVVKKGETDVWPNAAPELLASGKVKFMAHDFFQANPVEGADVYWLRGILHDWSDDYCVEILSNIRDQMGENSRILICDQVMNTTYGCEEIPGAPKPLPANYGYYTRFMHTRDLSLMACINGIERTPAQFKDIIEQAGLKLSKIYETRSLFGIIEVTINLE
nr:putative methyltransferase [Lachnum palmae]